MRRVVAGVGDDGRSRVVVDGPSPGIREVRRGADASPETLSDVPAELSDGQYVTCGLWYTEAPPDPNAPDRAADPIGLPAPGHTRWLLSVMGPNMNWPPHRTNTIDYGCVITGACDLVLDDDVVHLGPGDCVVINGANHGWRTGPEGCTKSTIVIGYADTEPVTLDATGPTAVEGGA